VNTRRNKIIVHTKAGLRECRQHRPVATALPFRLQPGVAQAARFPGTKAVVLLKRFPSGSKDRIEILTDVISNRPGTAGRDPQFILFPIPSAADRPSRVLDLQETTASLKNHRRVPAGFKSRPIPHNAHKITAPLQILSG
jgi:hypothetical protein